MRKIFVYNTLIIGAFLLFALSAEKLINKNSIGWREIIGSVVGALVGGLLATFLMKRYYKDDSEVE